MTLAAHVLSLFNTRAMLLVPVLGLALLLGELPARYSGLNLLLTHITGLFATLRRKLDRPQRGIATLVYRGMVATACALVPALALGILLSRPYPLLSIVILFLLTALYGEALQTYRLLTLLQKSRSGTLPLELPDGDFLFADTHAVLRYTILDSSESFAVALVGTSFWYVLGGLPLALPYLALAAAHRQFRSPAFGWAANALFHLLDALPRLLATLLLTLAACFTPGAHPRAAFRARNWTGLIAQLLGIALGGPLPDRIIPWAGEGTPKPEAAHLLRWLILRSVAWLLLILLLGIGDFPNILKFIK